MKRIVLVPGGGLCNRLRLIASGFRIAHEQEWDLEIVWKWGGWDDLFENLPYVLVHNKLPAAYRHLPVMRTILFKPGGEAANQRFHLPAENSWVVKGGHCFSLEGIAPSTPELLRSYYLRPSAAVKQTVEYYVQEHLNKPTLGFHIRRTDNWRSRRHSPDLLFREAIRGAVLAGYQIYLGTDNLDTLKIFQDEYGCTILNRPKGHQLEKRWPRQSSDIVDVKDDWIDLLLLSRCEYVVGSYISSYSETAIALNGHPKCMVLTAETLTTFQSQLHTR